MSDAEKFALQEIMDSLSECTDEESEELDRKLDQEEKERFTKQQTDRYLSCGVSRKYQSARLEDLLPALPDGDRELVHKFIDDVKNGKQRVLWLCGNKGTGKTALASAVLRELILSGQKGLFMESNDYMDRLKSAESFTAKETVRQVKDSILANGIIVFDEVGREFYGEFAKYQYFDFVNKAYAGGNSYIMTAQMSKKDLCAYLTSAAVDRLAGHCKCIEFHGESYRGKPGELYVM